MRKQNAYKLFAAWLFIIMLIFPYIGKTVHLHECRHSGEEEHEHTEHSRSYHDCKACHLCNFSFYSFTTPEEIRLTCVCFPVFINETTYIEKRSNQISFSFYTRGPPAVA